MRVDELVKINKDYFVQVSTLASFNMITGYLPFFKIPPLDKILTLLIKTFYKALADKIELVAFFQYIDLRVSKQGKEYVQAKREGYEIEINGTPEQKKAAEQKIIDSFRAFVKFSN